MANALQMAGAAAEPSNFAPLNTDRFFTGLWTYRNPLRDAATTANEERYYGARQDSILDGYNSEISAKLTLRRRYGLSAYNNNSFGKINRFYSFNTFTLTDEAIRVLADTDTDVWDVTNGGKTSIWHKGTTNPTFFLGVGNILYFTNGVENKQWNYTTNQTFNWGIVAPTNAPQASIQIFQSYGAWAASTVFSRPMPGTSNSILAILDPNANVQVCTHTGTTGTASGITWGTANLSGTVDGGVSWQNRGNGIWTPNRLTSGWDIIYATATDNNVYFYFALTNGTGSAGPITWLPGINSITIDGPIQWQNIGRILNRTEIGDNTPVVSTTTIEDSNSNIQSCIQAGKTGTTAPTWSQIKTVITSDPAGASGGNALWQNTGAVAAVQYGYAFMNSKTNDISNMSPPSLVLATNDGYPVTVTGQGSTDPQVDTIVLFRTLHGGSTFMYLASIPNNTASGWYFNYTDTVLDANLNVSWQGQVEGEGTPLPIGASCLEYHLGRIFAAVGNVVYVSSGPDAAVGGSSGKAGFDTTFTCQSKITRFWVNSLGIVVFTVRDSYIILGSATSSDPLYMIRWIDNIPLLSYDNFSVFLTSAYMFTGKRMVVTLDPSAGIVEISQPIANLVNAFDPQHSYTTFHSQQSGENALYVSDGASIWYRLAPTSAPESGSNWSPKAVITGGMSAVQSVEVSPGQYSLLLGPPASGGPILQRDLSKNMDNGVPFQAVTRFGSVVVAEPGQLAALAWMTLESQPNGTAPQLSVLLSEINETASSKFEIVPRSRQDPPNLPASQSYYSNRHYFLQSQNPVWCRHFQFEIVWPAEDAPNELLTFTIFGQTWSEMRSQ